MLSSEISITKALGKKAQNFIFGSDFKRIKCGDVGIFDIGHFRRDSFDLMIAHSLSLRKGYLKWAAESRNTPSLAAEIVRGINCKRLIKPEILRAQRWELWSHTRSF